MSKNIRDILNEIKEFRNNELVDKNDNSVFYTIAMKLESNDNTGKDIYRIIEEYSIGEDQSGIREIFYEYEDNPKFIAMLDSEKSEDLIFKKDITEEEKEQLIKDILERIENNKNKLKEQAEKIGINEKEELSEIDLYKKIDEKIEEKNERIKGNKKNSIVIDDEEEKDEKFEKDDEVVLTKNETQKRGIIGLNRINLDEVVGKHGETVRKEIGLDNYSEYNDIEMLAIVPSYKLGRLGGKIEAVPFYLIGINSKGEAVIFPNKVCHTYKGENDQATILDGDNDIAKKEIPDSIITFQNGKSILINQSEEEYGRLNASLAYNTRDNDGRLALKLRHENEGNRTQREEAREVMGQYEGTDYTMEAERESDLHPSKEYEDDKVKIEDVNGKPDASPEHNETHKNDVDSSRMDLINKAIENIAEKGNVSEDEAERLFVKNLNEAKVTAQDIKEKYTLDELKEVFDKVEEKSINEIEEQFRGKNSKG